MKVLAVAEAAAKQKAQDDADAILKAGLQAASNQILV